MCVATCIPCQDDFVFFSTGFKVTRWSVSLLLHIVLYVSTLQKSNAQSLSVYSYISVCNTCSEHNIMIHPALHAAAVTYVSMSMESSESFLLWSVMKVSTTLSSMACSPTSPAMSSAASCQCSICASAYVLNFGGNQCSSH